MLPVCVLSCRVPSNSGRTVGTSSGRPALFEQTFHRRIWSIRIHTHHARCLREEVREQRIGSAAAERRSGEQPSPARHGTCLESRHGHAAGRENGKLAAGADVHEHIVLAIPNCRKKARLIIPNRCGNTRPAAADADKTILRETRQKRRVNASAAQYRLVKRALFCVKKPRPAALLASITGVCLPQSFMAI